MYIECFNAATTRCLQALKQARENAPPLYDIFVRTMRAYLMGAITYEGSRALFNNVSQLPYLNTALYVSLIASSCYYTVDKEILGLLREWEARKLTRDMSKRDVVLMCCPQDDFNGSTTTLSFYELQALKEFASTHSIVYMKADRISDLNKVIDKLASMGKNIQFFWLKAHGKEDKIRLGQEIITERNASQIHFSKLAKDCNIILHACNTGKPLPQKANIAEVIQFYAGPGRKVHAPTKSSYWGRGYFTKRSPGKECIFEFKQQFLPLDITAKITYKNLMGPLTRSKGRTESR